MSVAPDVRSLKRRLDRFFWSNSSTETVLLRHLFKTHFDQFDGVGVIGGLVRDFARGGRSVFKSDIDLVVEGSAYEVALLADRVGATANRFGGFGFTAGPWKIDFWALEKTWAVAEGHVVVAELADVVQCTFFDWDAAIYDLRRKRVVCTDGYLDRIRGRRLEIALRSNPGELGNLLRAARRILGWGLRPGPELRRFIRERLDDDTFKALQATERRKHSDHLLKKFRDSRHLRFHLLASHRAEASDKLQMHLPFDQP